MAQNVRIQILHATDSEWKDPAKFGGVVLLYGEPALNLTTGEIRYGDGLHTWGELKNIPQYELTSGIIEGELTVTDAIYLTGNTGRATVNADGLQVEDQHGSALYTSREINYFNDNGEKYDFALPNKSGTFALQEDVDNKLDRTGGLINGDLYFSGGDGLEFQGGEQGAEARVSGDGIYLYADQGDSYLIVQDSVSSAHYKPYGIEYDDLAFYFPDHSGTFVIEDEEGYAYSRFGFKTGPNIYADDGIYSGDTYISLPSKDGTLALQEDIAPVKTEVELLSQALMQSGIMYTVDVESTYNERITADGLNVLDGSKAVLKKVVGSTVKCNNLIPFPYLITSSTNPAGTFTITAGADGSLTFNGSTTAYHQALLGYITLQAGTYYLSWNANKTATGVSVAIVDKRYAEGKITTTEQTTVQVLAIVQANTTADNVIYKPMLNAGETALPYEKYFTGLKNASFAGIESTGRNLFNINGNLTAGKRISTSSGGTYNAPLYSVSDYIFVKGLTYVAVSGTQTENGQYYYSIYDENKNFIAGGGYADGRYVPIPTNAYYLRFDFLSTATEVMANAGATALPYTHYIEPSVFNFTNENLGKWDSIDFENQKVVKKTWIDIFNGTEKWELQSVNSVGIYNYVVNTKRRVSDRGVCNFYEYDYNVIANATREGYMLATGGNVFIRTKSYTTVEAWKAHLAELYASGNPLMVAYELATAEETPFTTEQSASGNEYEVQKGGTERVIENDGAEYGANNTLTQNYIAIKE